MKLFKPKAPRLIAKVGLWWGIALLATSLKFIPAPLANLLMFSFLIFVPGYLTLLNCSQLKKLALWGRLAAVVATSLMELMVLILIGNALLPVLGVSHPLSSLSIVLQISMLVTALVFIVEKRQLKLELLPKFKAKNIAQHDKLLSFMPLIFVILAVLGAISINNGGSNSWTVIMLCSVVVYLIYLFFNHKKLSQNTIPTAIYFISLALLLMTSLRGWYITGHDVQREYLIFMQTKAAGLWHLDKLTDAYNACLSITILPTIFSNLLRSADSYIYKLYFQIIFAICPVLVYLIAKRWVSTTVALVATLYFIGFPTFFSDMPMLNRQEIAFLFFALMLLIIFETGLKLKLRRWLFVLFGFGVIISHYSTTYSLITIIGLAIVIRPILAYISRKPVSKAKSENRFLQPTGPAESNRVRNITIPMFLTLAAASFIWTGWLTHTSNGLSKVVAQTFSAIIKGENSDVKSGDVRYNLFSSHTVDAQALFNDYQNQVVVPARSDAPLDRYLPTMAIGSTDSPVKAVNAPDLPLTPIGRLAKHLHINVATLNHLTRQLLAKILQVFIIIGIIYMIVKRNFTGGSTIEYFALAIASLIFVMMQIVLPVLSVEYGLLRAFQQSLMLLGIFVIIGNIVLISKLKNRLLISVIPLAIAVLFFLSSTGVITQLLGGYPPQLHLNNGGLYYDLYYLHPSETAGMDWMSKNLQGAELQTEVVQSNRYYYDKLSTVASNDTFNDIYPALIRSDAVVFLGYTNTTKHEATISFNGNLITYRYPIEILDQNKDLLYSNGGSTVYR